LMRGSRLFGLQGRLDVVFAARAAPALVDPGKCFDYCGPRQPMRRRTSGQAMRDAGFTTNSAPSSRDEKRRRNHARHRRARAIPMAVRQAASFPAAHAGQPHRHFHPAGARAARPQRLIRRHPPRPSVTAYGGRTCIVETMMFKNITIKSLLLSVMGLLSLLLITTGAIGLYALHTTDESLKTVYEDRTVPLGHLNKVITDLTINQLDLVSSIYADPDQMTRTMDAIEARLKGIDQAF